LNAAISGGDFAHLIADEVFSEIEIEDREIKQKINSLYFEMQFEVHAGQADDSFGVGIAELEDATEKQVFRMIDYKSGRYSIQKPMLLGAALAGMSEDNLAKLDKIGQDLGLVFQIKDDILGLYGSEEEIGKSNTSDITEGKRTVLMIRTFEVASEEDKEKIKNILGNPDASSQDIEWLKEAVKGYGVLEEIETFCAKMVEDSKKGLEEIFDVKNNPGATFLYELADFIWYRKK
jgi:geranylgeranyl diphosphate synthase type I